MWSGIVAGHVDRNPPRCVKELTAEVKLNTTLRPLGSLKPGERFTVGCHAQSREWEVLSVKPIGEKDAESGYQMLNVRFSLAPPKRRKNPRKGVHPEPKPLPSEWMVVEPFSEGTGLGNFFAILGYGWYDRRPFLFGRVLSVVYSD